MVDKAFDNKSIEKDKPEYKVDKGEADILRLSMAHMERL